jgi:NADH dehydrogenase (ubiquinone) 1 alpha subcomplex subunit 5
VYRKSAEALTHCKLKLMRDTPPDGDVAAVERALDEGQIEEALDAAGDEFRLVEKMVEWKA